MNPFMRILISAAAIVLVVSCSPEEETNLKLPKVERLAAKAQWMNTMLADPATGRIPRGALQHQVEWLHASFPNKGLRNSTLSEQWRSIGPVNVGGRTRAIAIDVLNEDHLVAGGVSGGVWNSYDQGKTWAKATESTSLHSVTSLVQDQRSGHENVWYATTGEVRGNVFDFLNGDGVMKSVDNGQSWQLLESTSTGKIETVDSPFDLGMTVAVDHTSENGDVYVATFGFGIWRSQDGGSTWSPIIGQRSDEVVTGFSEILVTHEGVLFVVVDGDERGIFMSDDGDNWTDITPSWATPFDASRALLHYSEVSQELFVFTESNLVGHSDYTFNKPALLVRNSLGEWENRSDNLPSPASHGWQVMSQDNYCMLLSVHPTDANTVFIGGTSLYRSTDGFRTPDNITWIGGYHADAPPQEAAFYPGSHPDMHSMIFFASNPDKTLNSHDGGISVSENIRAQEVEWDSLNNGYVTTQLYDIGIQHMSDSKFVAAGPQDHNVLLTTTANSDDDWSVVNVIGDGLIAEFSEDGRSLYAGRQWGQTYRFSIDEFANIQTWTAVSPPNFFFSSWFGAFSTDPLTDSVVYFGGGTSSSGVSYLPNVYELPDKQLVPNGEYWKDILQTGDPVSVIEVVEEGGIRVMYVGTEGGEIFRIEEPLSESPQVRNYFYEAAYVSSITIDPQDINHVFFTFSNFGVVSIWESVDGGETAHRISGNLEHAYDGSGSGPGVLALLYVRNEQRETLVCATTVGLFATEFLNGPNTSWEWVSKNDIGHVLCFDLEYREQDDWLVVGTYGTGVWEGTLPVLEKQSIGVPTLLSPQSEATWINSESQFIWNNAPGALTHEMQVSTSSDFTENVFVEQGLVGGQHMLQHDLEAGTQYYWRMRGFNATSQGEWSESKTFATPPIPVLIKPDNRTDTTISVPVSCSWVEVPGATSYRLEVSRIPSFGVKVSDTAGLVNTSMILSNLLENTVYYWRVKATGPAGQIVVSPSWQFKTSPVVGVANQEKLGLSVYPNPAANRIQVRLEDAEITSDIELRIVDMQGTVLVSSQHQFGTEYSLDVSAFVSGTYFLSVVSLEGNYTASKAFTIKR